MAIRFFVIKDDVMLYLSTNNLILAKKFLVKGDIFEKLSLIKSLKIQYNIIITNTVLKGEY